MKIFVSFYYPQEIQLCTHNIYKLSKKMSFYFEQVAAIKIDLSTDFMAPYNNNNKN